MKKYFAIAFVVLVLLLLVGRKLTEPRELSRVVAPVVEDQQQPALPEPAVAPAGGAAAGAGVPGTGLVKPDSGGGTSVAPPFKSLEELRAMAKTSLMTAFSSEKAFQAEWSRFSSDLVMQGWTPLESDMSYKFGFLERSTEAPIDDGSTQEDPSRFSTDAFINQDTSETSERFRYTPAAERIRLSDYARFCDQGCRAGKDSFEALIAVPLDDHGHVDVWTVNERKELKLVVDGTK